MDVTSNVNFLLSSNKKSFSFRELSKNLDQNLITAIYTLDSTLATSLIKSRKVDFLFSSLIPAEAVDNNQRASRNKKLQCYVNTLGALWD